MLHWDESFGKSLNLNQISHIIKNLELPSKFKISYISNALTLTLADDIKVLVYYHYRECHLYVIIFEVDSLNEIVLIWWILKINSRVWNSNSPRLIDLQEVSSRRILTQHNGFSKKSPLVYTHAILNYEIMLERKNVNWIVIQKYHYNQMIIAADATTKPSI